MMTTRKESEFFSMELKEIVRKIVEAKRAYYGPSGKPIMSDQEYDALEDLLRELCPDHPVLAKVGSEPSSAWEKATHDMPMGSLAKVHGEEEFRKWASKFPPDTLFIAQPKLDGLSIELKYQGNLVQAVTRGDGTTGENILMNALKMKGVVKDSLAMMCSVRAEVLLLKSDFERINDTILNEKDKYSNERNAAAGISRRLDGAYCQYLNVIAYDITSDYKSELPKETLDRLPYPDEVDKPSILSNMGLIVPPTYTGGVEAMVNAFKKFKLQRDDYEFCIDGVVIKVNSSKTQNEMGSINGKPRAQIAWKFDPPGAAATLESISWEVGRTGVVTPLGHVKPVEIDGSIISNVTLHNIAQISRLNIGISDTVMLVKAGDIIPFIESVLEHKGQPIEIPTHCPSCGEPLENNDIQLFCRNVGCPAKNFFRIMNWIKVTEIDNFGESLLDRLFDDKGIVREIADIYKLTPQDIASIEGWGEHSAEVILDNIEKTRVMEPERFLTAIGIPGISNKTAEDLIKKFGSMEAVLQAKEPDIVAMRGYSDISAKAIVDGLKGFQEEILNLMKIIKFENQDTEQGKLAGMTFCFTGAMARPRSEYQDMVKVAGGKNLSSVTKDLKYLVCNEDHGSSKSQKAKKYGTKIITEQEFLAMIGDIPVTTNSTDKTAVLKNIPLFEK